MMIALICVRHVRAPSSLCGVTQSEYSTTNCWHGRTAGAEQPGEGVGIGSSRKRPGSRLEPIGATPHLRPFRLAYQPPSLGLSTTSQQYFSLRTNQPPATSQQYSSLRTNQHQPSATSQPNRLHSWKEKIKKGSSEQRRRQAVKARMVTAEKKSRMVA
jgi:hypothetical protein